MLHVLTGVLHLPYICSVKVLCWQHSVFIMILVIGIVIIIVMIITTVIQLAPVVMWDPTFQKTKQQLTWLWTEAL